MIEFINKVTGTRMWVAENRAEEYKAAGHTPAVVPVAKKTTVPKKRKTAKK